MEEIHYLKKQLQDMQQQLDNKTQEVVDHLQQIHFLDTMLKRREEEELIIDNKHKEYEELRLLFQ